MNNNQSKMKGFNPTAYQTLVLFGQKLFEVEKTRMEKEIAEKNDVNYAMAISQTISIVENTLKETIEEEVQLQEYSINPFNKKVAKPLYSYSKQRLNELLHKTPIEYHSLIHFSEHILNKLNDMESRNFAEFFANGDMNNEAKVEFRAFKEVMVTSKEVVYKTLEFTIEDLTKIEASFSNLHNEGII